MSNHVYICDNSAELAAAFASELKQVARLTEKYLQEQSDDDIENIVYGACSSEYRTGAYKEGWQANGYAGGLHYECELQYNPGGGHWSWVYGNNVDDKMPDIVIGGEGPLRGNQKKILSRIEPAAVAGRDHLEATRSRADDIALRALNEVF